MKKLFLNPAQIVTVDTGGINYKRGQEMNDTGVLTGHSILVEDGIIADILPKMLIPKSGIDEIVDCSRKVILPGLIECHTHSVFAGSRAVEFKRKLEGVSYEEIAKSGGGINTTVQAVRKSSFEELAEITAERIEYFIKQGITTLEIKSGYGLSFYDETKLLQVIKHLKEKYQIDLLATFLGAHTFPPEFKNDHDKYVDIIINEMIPYAAEKGLADFCDAFCESTAFSAEQTDRIFTAADANGLKLKLHTEQFNRIGGLDTALKHKAVSVDHLEALDMEDIKIISDSETAAVLLPGVSFFLNYQYAPARELIDGGSIVALSTDFNPGSSNIAELNFIMSLAAIKMGMTIDETISAVTINAAKALDVHQSTGSIEIGKKADLAIFDADDYSEIVYQVGKNLNSMTVKNGEIIYKSK